MKLIKVGPRAETAHVAPFHELLGAGEKILGSTWQVKLPALMLSWPGVWFLMVQGLRMRQGQAVGIPTWELLGAIPQKGESESHKN